MNQQIRPGKFPMDINNFDGQQPAASKFDPSLHLLDVNKMNLSKSIETSSRYFYVVCWYVIAIDTMIWFNLNKLRHGNWEHSIPASTVILLLISRRFL